MSDTMTTDAPRSEEEVSPQELTAALTSIVDVLTKFDVRTSLAILSNVFMQLGWMLDETLYAETYDEIFAKVKARHEAGEETLASSLIGQGLVLGHFVQHDLDANNPDAEVEEDPNGLPPLL